METTKTERIRLGLFLLLCFGAILIFAVYMIGQSLKDIKVGYYTVFSESVDGLSKDAKVMLNGIDVGKVTRIHIDSTNLNNTVVRFEVAKGTPIKTGTRAQMTNGFNLTGNKFLILSGGSLNENDVPPESLVIAGVNALSQIGSNAGNIIEKIDALITNFNKMLSDENAEKISRSLTNIESATENANKLVKKAETPIGDLAKATTSLKNITAEIEATHVAKSIDSTLKIIDSQIGKIDMESINGDIQETLKSIKRLSKRADAFLYKNQGEISTTLEELNEILENLNEFSQKIKENPSSILRENKTER